jgi:hypothetical protein
MYATNYIQQIMRNMIHVRIQPVGTKLDQSIIDKWLNCNHLENKEVQLIARLRATYQENISIDGPPKMENEQKYTGKS